MTREQHRENTSLATAARELLSIRVIFGAVATLVLFTTIQEIEEAISDKQKNKSLSKTFLRAKSRFISVKTVTKHSVTIQFCANLMI
jgi:hypothetical protein